MKNRLLAAGAIAFGFLVVSTAMFAHHGATAYDTRSTVTLKGTVISFDWSNPHALIQFDVKNGQDDAETWTAETAGLIILVRAGWTKTVLKSGDQVTIVGHRAKNGTHSMILQSVELSDGRKLNNFVPRS